MSLWALRNCDENFFTICFTFYKLNNNNNNIDNDRFALHSMHHVRHGVVCITLHLIQRLFSPAKLSCFIRKLTFSQNLNLIFLKGNAVDEWGKHWLHTQNQTPLCVVVFFWGPHHFDLKGLLNEPVEMKGWILPWVTAANTNLPEVLMAAVMFERTVLISKGCISSRSSGLAVSEPY